MQASPFLIEVYAEKCTPSLKVSNIDVGGKILMNAVIEMVIRKVVVVGLFLVIFHLLKDVNKPAMSRPEPLSQGQQFNQRFASNQMIKCF